MNTDLPGFVASQLETDLAADEDGSLRDSLAARLDAAAQPVRQTLSQGLDKADFKRWSAALDALEAARRALPLLGPIKRP